MSASTITWDLGSGYDLFVSLHVVHNPARFGLRGSWAAGVRSRLPLGERNVLEQAVAAIGVPLHWLSSLPGEKTGAGVLHALGEIPPPERLPVLALSPGMEAGQADLYREVAARGAWQPADLERLKPFFKGRPWPLAPRRLEAILHAWAQSADFGRLLLPALQVYHQVFFHEEEQRIRPALKEALQHARDLSQRLPLADLLEELSQGVRFSPQQLDTPQVILAPSYWSTPLLFYGRVNETSRLFLFGARPASASLVPGEVVPDSLLNSLKALSDATRLRILRYLIAAPQTPAQLSRRLRLRAPTVVHHLSELRLAGLVQLTIDIPERKKGERRYAVRKEAVEQLCALLQDFLSQPDAA